METVADYSGRSPMDLPPLYEAIDPEALDVLVRSDSVTGSIELQYGEYEVTIHDEETVDVEATDERRTDSASESGEQSVREACTHCEQRFDGAVRDPAVTVAEVDDERVVHSFCADDCLFDWASDD